MGELRIVLRVEPDNREAKQRLAILAHPPAPAEGGASSPEAPASKVATAVTVSDGKEKAIKATGSTDKATASANVSMEVKKSSTEKGAKAAKATNVLEDDDEDEKGVDFASTSALLNTATEYMKKNDYASALQVYNYARRSCRHWDSALAELKAL